MPGIEHLIGTFCKVVGIEPPEPDEDGARVLLFDRDYAVRCKPTGRGMLLVSGVAGRLPEGTRAMEDLARKLLKTNLARMFDQREVLSVDHESGEIVLHLETPDDIGADAFKDMLEGFVNNLEFWSRQTVEAPRPQSPLTMIFP